jgi:hypothetical protein
MTNFRKDWPALRDMVWDWDPIGLGNDRKYCEDEYDCIINDVISKLRLGASAGEISLFLDELLPEHFGLTTQTEEAAGFAKRMTSWWTAKHPPAQTHDA